MEKSTLFHDELTQKCGKICFSIFFFRFQLFKNDFSPFQPRKRVKKTKLHLKNNTNENIKKNELKRSESLKREIHRMMLIYSRRVHMNGPE